MSIESRGAVKAIRITWWAGVHLPSVPPPRSHVWLVQPNHAAAAAHAWAALPAAGRPRVVVEGLAAVDLPGESAIIEGGPATAGAVQRALQLGAPFVELTGAARGAAVVGASAWYHGWILEGDRSKMSGALVGAMALRAALLEEPCFPMLEIEASGAAVATPVDRPGAIARLLLEPGVGPSLPETTVNLTTVHLLDAGPRSLRITGVRSEGGLGSRQGLSIRFRGQVHSCPPTPGAPGSHVPLHLAERTMTVGLVGDARIRVPAGDVVRVWAADHADHTVLALATRHADDWSIVDDWATVERASDWFGTPAHVTRHSLPSLSALRFVCSAPDRSRGIEAVGRALVDEIVGFEDT